MIAKISETASRINTAIKKQLKGPLDSAEELQAIEATSLPNHRNYNINYSSIFSMFEKNNSR